MDAHFREYLAAIAGMQDVYGESADRRPSEFHDDPEAVGSVHGLLADTLRPRRSHLSPEAPMALAEDPAAGHGIAS